MNSLNSVDRNGESALFRAIYGNHEGVVRILLATPGINVTLSNRDGHSPLATAVCYGPYLQTFGIIQMLLERDDVDPDAGRLRDNGQPCSMPQNGGMRMP